MSSQSILFNNIEDRSKSEQSKIPNFFYDLNLDQIINKVTANWTEYNLKSFFYFKLDDTDSIVYRQEVFRDLENKKIFESVVAFTEAMRKVREYLNLKDKLHYLSQKKIWFLYAAEIYCNAVKNFVTNLQIESLSSRGFIKFQTFLINYSNGLSFNSLYNSVKKIVLDLTNVKYRILIKGNSFTVKNDEQDSDYSFEILNTFEKFKQGNVKDYRVKYEYIPESMNHIEDQILDFVAKLNEELFQRLDNLFVENQNFIDQTISTFDREIHFYLAYIQHIKKLKEKGLSFCYPKIVSNSKEINNYDGFDLALAQKLYDEDIPIVCNDFYLKGNERIFIITGPNQGGKTTFARMFGQLHFLANIGCPVPGKDSQLFLFDNIFTQFERVEKTENLRGKLEDDLIRIYSILQKATTRSILIMNEIFCSTTLQDMTFLSRKILEKIVEHDLLCAWVTFVDELISINKQVVSVTSMVDPLNPSLRTYKIIRRNADGLAYAMAIVQKYNLTYNQIKERIEQ